MKLIIQGNSFNTRNHFLLAANWNDEFVGWIRVFWKESVRQWGNWKLLSTCNYQYRSIICFTMDELGSPAHSRFFNGLLLENIKFVQENHKEKPHKIKLYLKCTPLIIIPIIPIIIFSYNYNIKIHSHYFYYYYYYLVFCPCFMFYYSKDKINDEFMSY
jgi:hypothetical protein